MYLNLNSSKLTSWFPKTSGIIARRVFIWLSSMFKYVKFWYLKLREILRDIFREFDNLKLIDIVEAKRKEC